MCFIVFAYQVHPSYRFIAAANRDEFYERPTSPADFWKESPQVLAGRDLQEGGTWMGVTRGGKFAAITNYRDPNLLKKDAPSRGRLVSDYLFGSANAAFYIEKIFRQGQEYNGFNLICGDLKDLFVYSNRGSVEKLGPGIYGLSNHLLNSPWPKITRGREALRVAMQKRGTDLEKALFSILSNRKKAPDPKLPSTGIGLEMERLLSPIFIESPGYGTRSSTVLLMARNKRVKFVEKVFDGQSEPWIENRFSFLLPGTPLKSP